MSRGRGPEGGGGGGGDEPPEDGDLNNGHEGGDDRTPEEIKNSWLDFGHVLNEIADYADIYEDDAELYDDITRNFPEKVNAIDWKDKEKREDGEEELIGIVDEIKKRILTGFFARSEDAKRHTYTEEGIQAIANAYDELEGVIKSSNNSVPMFEAVRAFNAAIEKGHSLEIINEVQEYVREMQPLIDTLHEIAHKLKQENEGAYVRFSEEIENIFSLADADDVPDAFRWTALLEESPITAELDTDSLIGTKNASKNLERMRKVAKGDRNALLSLIRDFKPLVETAPVASEAVLQDGVAEARSENNSASQETNDGGTTDALDEFEASIGDRDISTDATTEEAANDKDDAPPVVGGGNGAGGGGKPPGPPEDEKPKKGKERKDGARGLKQAKRDIIDSIANHGNPAWKEEDFIPRQINLRETLANPNNLSAESINASIDDIKRRITDIEKGSAKGTRETEKNPPAAEDKNGDEKKGGPEEAAPEAGGPAPTGPEGGAEAPAAPAEGAPLPEALPDAVAEATDEDLRKLGAIDDDKDPARKGVGRTADERSKGKKDLAALSAEVERTRNEYDKNYAKGEGRSRIVKIAHWFTGQSKKRKDAQVNALEAYHHAQDAQMEFLRKRRDEYLEKSRLDTVRRGKKWTPEQEAEQQKKFNRRYTALLSKNVLLPEWQKESNIGYKAVAGELSPNKHNTLDKALEALGPEPSFIHPASSKSPKIEMEYQGEKVKVSQFSMLPEDLALAKERYAKDVEAVKAKHERQELRSLNRKGMLKRALAGAALGVTAGAATSTALAATGLGAPIVPIKTLFNAIRGASAATLAPIAQEIVVRRYEKNKGKAVREKAAKRFAEGQELFNNNLNLKEARTKFIQEAELLKKHKAKKDRRGKIAAIATGGAVGAVSTAGYELYQAGVLPDASNLNTNTWHDGHRPNKVPIVPMEEPPEGPSVDHTPGSDAPKAKVGFPKGENPRLHSPEPSGLEFETNLSKPLDLSFEVKDKDNIWNFLRHEYHERYPDLTNKELRVITDKFKDILVKMAETPEGQEMLKSMGFEARNGLPLHPDHIWPGQHINLNLISDPYQTDSFYNEIIQHRSHGAGAHPTRASHGAGSHQPPTPESRHPVPPIAETSPGDVAETPGASPEELLAERYSGSEGNWADVKNLSTAELLSKVHYKDTPIGAHKLVVDAMRGDGSAIANVRFSPDGGHKLFSAYYVLEQAAKEGKIPGGIESYQPAPNETIEDSVYKLLGQNPPPHELVNDAVEAPVSDASRQVITERTGEYQIDADNGEGRNIHDAIREGRPYSKDTVSYNEAGQRVERHESFDPNGNKIDMHQTTSGGRVENASVDTSPSAESPASEVDSGTASAMEEYGIPSTYDPIPFDYNDFRGSTYKAMGIALYDAEHILKEHAGDREAIAAATNEWARTHIGGMNGLHHAYTRPVTKTIFQHGYYGERDGTMNREVIGLLKRDIEIVQKTLDGLRSAGTGDAGFSGEMRNFDQMLQFIRDRIDGKNITRRV